MPRCTATPKDLDGDGAMRRTRDYTDALVEHLELGELWDDFGVVGDIIVSLKHKPFLSYE
jgi:hypothetical protein